MKKPQPGQPYASGENVYVLIDPRFPLEDGSDWEYELFYVGHTKSMRRRLWQHLRNAKRYRGNPELGAWIRELLRLGLCPRIELVIPCSTRYAAEVREAALIKQLRKTGYRLCNTQHNTQPARRRWPQGRRLPRGRRLPTGRRLRAA